MCEALKVHLSGFCQWLQQPSSPHLVEDRRLLGLIEQSWLETGCVYGYRKVFANLRELGERFGNCRVERLMSSNGIHAQVGFGKRKATNGRTAATVAANVLNRQFEVAQPNETWVTDITCIRTFDGWLYLAVVLNLVSRHVIGRSMHSSMQADLVMRALVVAVWRRQPEEEVLVNSDQSSQYTSNEWQDFLKVLIITNMAQFEDRLKDST